MSSRLLCVLFVAIGVAAQQRAPSSSPPPARRAYAISGTVVDGLSGSSLAEAEVTIIPSGKRDQLQSTTSDDAGRFEFKDLAPGKYVLGARRRGYPTQPFDSHAGFSTGIAVGPGKQSDNLLFRLKPDASISGRVSDDEGEAIRGAEVMLFSRNVDSGERTIQIINRTLTDDQGAYHFGHLGAGEYFVGVQSEVWYALRGPQRANRSSSTDGEPQATSNAQLDVGYPVTYYPSAVMPDDAGAITLAWGDRVTADVILHALPTVTVRIRQDPSFPIERANLRRVLLGGVEDSITSPTVTVSEDLVEISGVAPGRYNAMESPPTKPQQRATASLRSGSTPPHYQMIDASESVDIDAHDSSEWASISGSVSLEGQTIPRPEMSLELRNRAGGDNVRVSIGSNGEFENAEAPPGRYEVILQSSDGYILKSISTLNAKVNGQTIEISAGIVRLALLASRGTGQVDGVVMRDNKPVAGAMVILVPQDPANNRPLFRRDQSDSDGTFTLPAIASGKYTIVAIEDGWELEWANPAVLAAYLPKGRVVQVEAGSKLNVTVKSVAASAPVPSTTPTK